jgi:hypothetical protein
MKTARRVAAAKALAVIAGLATVILGVATGNWPVVLIAAAVTSGAGLLAAVAELRETEARSDAACRRHQMELAIEQERGRELGIEERMASLQACYASLESELAPGSGRFRERVSAEPEPGRDRPP